MKLIFISVSVVSLLLGLTCGSWAQTDRLYPIYELTDEDLEIIDLHDGSVADWLEVVGEPSIMAWEFVAYPLEDMFPYDLHDLDFRIWLGWHRSTSHIYVAMERVDDIYSNDFDRTGTGMESNPGYQDTSIDFIVDGDHSGGQYSMYSDLEEEERQLLENQQAQAYGAIGETYDDGTHVFIYFQGFREYWFLQPPYAEGGGRAVGENPVVSVTEFYVTPFDRLVWNNPEESVVSELNPGKIIGFNFGVVDRDGDYSTGAYRVLTKNEMYPYQENTDFFADGLLVGAGGVIPEDTAVENRSWGRIKASFKE